ncbi:MAG: hypothetical protein ACI9UA_004056 [Pseudoalteromonas tetraodonis]|jgi:hypothetical protein
MTEHPSYSGNTHSAMPVESPLLVALADHVNRHRAIVSFAEIIHSHQGDVRTSGTGVGCYTEHRCVVGTCCAFIVAAHFDKFGDLLRFEITAGRLSGTGRSLDVFDLGVFLCRQLLQPECRPGDSLVNRNRVVTVPVSTLP